VARRLGRLRSRLSDSDNRPGRNQQSRGVRSGTISPRPVPEPRAKGRLLADPELPSLRRGPLVEAAYFSLEPEGAWSERWQLISEAPRFLAS
jgi:hypothetical protein